MKQTVQIEGSLEWKWGRTQNGRYIAICQPLGQTLQAERFPELLGSIVEALESTFRELCLSGDLEKFLMDRGWKVNLPAEPKNARFEMPFELKGMKRRDFAEALC
jgi:hypothetical protein